MKGNDKPRDMHGIGALVVAIAGSSGTGKTTLLEAMLPGLCRAGLTVGLVKHAHDGFDPDLPGKDSHRLRHAGAQQVLVASRHRRARFAETADDEPPDLATLVADLDPTGLDLILAEGFHAAPVPRLVVHRAGCGAPRTDPAEPGVVALVSDDPPPAPVPVLPLNEPLAVADFLATAAARWQHGEDPW